MVKTVGERFWAKVDKNGPVVRDEIGPCWLWTGGDDGRSAQGEGYGKFLFNGVYRRAHRVSYIMANGGIEDGLCVMHMCDTPKCVNPEHLRAGTLKDNMQDMISKGRKGKKPKFQKDRLTEEEVIAIYMSDEPNRALARSYDISSTATVRDIKAGRSYAKFTRSLRQQLSSLQPSPEESACTLELPPNPSRSDPCVLTSLRALQVQEQGQELQPLES